MYDNDEFLFYITEKIETDSQELIDEIFHNPNERSTLHEYIIGNLIDDYVIPNYSNDIINDKEKLNKVKTAIFEKFKEKLKKEIDSWELEIDEEN